MSDERIATLAVVLAAIDSGVVDLSRAEAHVLARHIVASDWFACQLAEAESERQAEEDRANENATLVHEARAERDARVAVLDCNAADLHDDPHVWDFGSGEHFVCFGREAGKWTDDDVPEWKVMMPPLDSVDHDGAGACHCGHPLAYGFDGDQTHHRGMCDRCDSVRCDAYPGECGR